MLGDRTGRLGRADHGEQRRLMGAVRRHLVREGVRPGRAAGSLRQSKTQVIQVFMTKI